MSDSSMPFAFSQFVPGFDFLKNLAGGKAAASAGAVPGMPSLSSWVAPTLSVEEVDKRIQELKTVQYWLEQNGHALKATIQALEVQKMTLSTLRGMNVRMEDLASAFTRAAGAASASAASTSTATPFTSPVRAEPPAPAPEATSEPEGDAAQSADESDKAGGVVDPLQWWGALTQQFQQIASSALQDAAQMKMPMGAATSQPARKAEAGAARKKSPAAKKTSRRKAPAASRVASTAATSRRAR
jgi:hypothetical protein